MSTVSPRFITNPEASQEVVINGGFSLTCTAEGFPRPSIIWFMNDTMISNGVSDFNTSMTVLTSTLTISNANFNDSGMYYCQAVSSEFADLNVTSGVGIIAVVGKIVYYLPIVITSVVVHACTCTHKTVHIHVHMHTHIHMHVSTQKTCMRVYMQYKDKIPYQL